jgi:hypothetical protein
LGCPEISKLKAAAHWESDVRVALEKVHVKPRVPKKRLKFSVRIRPDERKPGC